MFCVVFFVGGKTRWMFFRFLIEIIHIKINDDEDQLEH